MTISFATAGLNQSGRRVPRVNAHVCCDSGFYHCRERMTIDDKGKALQKIRTVSFVLLEKKMILAMLKRVQHRVRSLFLVSIAAPKPSQPPVLY